MVDFLGSAAPRTDTAAQKELLKQHIQTETNLVQAQQLMNNSTEKCYARCVLSPGNELSNKEKTCLSSCFDKYLEAFNVVSRTYTARLARQRAEHQSQLLST